MTTLLRDSDHERLVQAWNRLEQAAEASARRSRERRTAGGGRLARALRRLRRGGQGRSAMR
jgi:hypothetical protein